MSKVPRDDSGRPVNARWSARGLGARLALAIALPPAVGGLVASFIPWPEWQWPGFAIAAFLTALGAWIWLRVATLRRLAAVARALVPDSDAKAASPGGGVSALVEAAYAARARERELTRGAERLELVRAALVHLGESAGEWAETERAPRFDRTDAPEEVLPLIDRLALAATRLEERTEAARAVAGQVRETVADAGERARALAGAAERQFVEATSLLAVLRGLEKPGLDLSESVTSLAAGLAAGQAGASSARAAAHEWARGAKAQLEAIERAAARLRAAAQDLQAVHEQAQLAALESAHAALDRGDLSAPDRVRLAEALTLLVQSSARAGARARDLAESAAQDLAEAHEEFGRRGAVATPGEDEADAARAGEAAIAARRGLERLRDSVKDAIARGERLVQQAERTSSEAHRAGDGVVAAVDEVDGLASRLAESPPLAAEEPPAAPLELAEPPVDPGAADEADGPPRPLRVLGPEDLLPDDENWSHG